MSGERYSALVLAAGRGSSDPMVQAYGIAHKCLLDVGGEPMIMRVLKALAASDRISGIAISIDDASALEAAAGFAQLAANASIAVVASADQASSSVAQAIASGAVSYPVLVTTADHALLTPDIVEEFCTGSLATGADLTVGLARERTILDAYPDSVRTFLRFADGNYSGCNLFSFATNKAERAVAFWQKVERNRKTPWKLIGAFGLVPLVRYVTGTLSLKAAFEGGSRKLNLKACPVELSAAEAAIDVDKPADLELVNAILSRK